MAFNTFIHIFMYYYYFQRALKRPVWYKVRNSYLKRHFYGSFLLIKTDRNM